MSDVTEIHQRILEQVANDAINNLGAYTELLAGAYTVACNLDPRECMVVQQHKPDGILTFFAPLSGKAKGDYTKGLAAENAALRGRIKDLEDEIKRAYQDGFNDGYAFFPDLGHGKVEGE